MCYRWRREGKKKYDKRTYNYWASRKKYLHFLVCIWIISFLVPISLKLPSKFWRRKHYFNMSILFNNFVSCSTSVKKINVWYFGVDCLILICLFLWIAFFKIIHIHYPSVSEIIIIIIIDTYTYNIYAVFVYNRVKIES